MKLSKRLRQMLRISIWALGLFFLYIVAVLGYGTYDDWQPPAISSLEAFQVSEKNPIRDSVLSFVTWNLGYGGLGEESDFFYDHGNMFRSGGRMVYAPRQYVEKNIAGDTLFVQTTQSDFFLFQEVDVYSKRSYYINQFEEIGEELPGYASFFAPNYKVSRVPIPLLEPWKAYGRVLSGLATYSRFQPYESIRLQLPGSFAWPTRIFQLDRCVALHRYRIANGKELAVMNVHNSAYDADGSLKRQQMAFLREVLMEEYDKGHYVIVGGDWNQCPPYFRFDGFMPGFSDGYNQINIDPDFLPADWQWVYDPTTPTNRKVRTPYVAGKSFVTLIDFFLISPNVRVRKVKGLDQQFRFSDHQPVWMEVELQ
ncbi:MAG: endonuclease/exonuclease/phosphatase family protein [Lewinellaceae bacterium]|nr:endonuclease/exonuclease/phosphatase family protein [Phaeodactylibacter sp.]MCB0613351.1 endonuclease/exonuclease/phosphatase family protein [Phaeodactylibacter sp.]MCB9349432.1 endonuclease/exonuclease/phosphatase family protein [Lewinellaceae bacterium]